MSGQARRVALATGNEGYMDSRERGGILVMGAAVVLLGAASCGDEVVVCAGAGAGDGGGGVIVVVSGSFYHGRWSCGCGGFGA